MALSQKEIKLIRSLHFKKYRKQYNLFVAEGKKLVEDLLQSDLRPFRLLTTLPTEVLTYELIDERIMKSLSKFESPSTHMGVFHMPPLYTLETFRPKRFFALHALQDPGNLGTILRSLDWFGPIPVVIFTGTVDPFSPKVVQASMGSVGRVPMIKSDYSTLHQYLKKEKIPLIAAHMSGRPIAKCSLDDRLCLVIGNEGQGLTDFPLLPDEVISIPPSPHTKAESLNAAVSVGILAYHLFSTTR
ncbi:MAG: TrmH family RNA methyltransferase [Thermaurantimonas sp.]